MSEDPFRLKFNFSGRGCGKKFKAEEYLAQCRKENNIIKCVTNDCLPEGMILISNGEQQTGTMKVGEKTYLAETPIYQSYTGERYFRNEQGGMTPLKYGRRAFTIKDE